MTDAEDDDTIKEPARGTFRFNSLGKVLWWDGKKWRGIRSPKLKFAWVEDDLFIPRQQFPVII